MPNRFNCSLSKKGSREGVASNKSKTDLSLLSLKNDDPNVVWAIESKFF